MQAWSLFLLFATVVAPITLVSAHRRQQPAPVQVVLVPSCEGRLLGDFLPDPISCAHFYVCINGRAIHRRCGRGYYFDSKAMACNFAELVECNLNGTQPAGDQPSSTVAPDCNPVNTTVPGQRAGNTTEATTVEPDCNPANATGTDTKQTNNSTKTNHHHHRHSRKQTTDLSSSCDDSEDITVATEEPETVSTDCDTDTRNRNRGNKHQRHSNRRRDASTPSCDDSEDSTTIAPQESDCHSNDSRNRNKANKRQRHSKKRQQATTPSCEDETETPSPGQEIDEPVCDTTTQKPIRRILASFNDCLGLADGTFLLDARHCRRYYVCADGFARRVRCSRGQWFDYEKQVCANSREVTNCPAMRN